MAFLLLAIGSAISTALLLFAYLVGPIDLKERMLARNCTLVYVMWDSREGNWVCPDGRRYRTFEEKQS